MKNLLTILFLFVIIIPYYNADTIIDNSSLANINEVVQDKIKLSLRPDFHEKILYGKATLIMEVVKNGVQNIILDAESLKIFSVHLNKIETSYDKVFKKSEKNPLGQGIRIKTNQPLPLNSKITIVIRYSTTVKSSSLHFVEPNQTLGKNYWYVYSQCSAILCRGLFPSQDSPSRKSLFEAKLTVKKPYKALFSGIQIKKRKLKDSVQYYYKTPIIAPTHSIGIAIGLFKSIKLSNRIRLYAEKEIINKAAKEFEDTEKMIRIVENYLRIPYPWKEYNILVAPNSFPYSAMENVCLTFVNPSVICGDKSQISTIAHEVSHSWAGNLVSIMNWDNFWMKEAFARFLEMKIMGNIRTKEHMDLILKIKYKSLKRLIRKLGLNSKMTRLNPQLKNVNPDSYFSSVPYDKGLFFLKYLESILGESLFRKLLISYFKEFSNDSVTYMDFIHTVTFFVEQNFSESASGLILKKLNLKKQINSSGLPLKQPKIYNKLIDRIELNVYNFIQFKELSDKFVMKYHNWHFYEKYYFLTLVFRNNLFFNHDIYYNLIKEKLFKGEMNIKLKSILFFVKLRLFKNKITLRSIKKFLNRNWRIGYISLLYKYTPKRLKNFVVNYLRENKTKLHPLTYRKLKKKLRL